MPRFSRAAEDRRNRRGLAVVAVLLLGLAAALAAYAGAALHRGSFDARSRYATAPAYLYAAEEPVWFYGLVLGMLALAGYLLYLGVRMARHARRR
ncbi:MAG TPA: hypothetical protein VK002_02580 [Rubricoccaceae bacterium]|nr:hypothetical protein [Rubricoccaceae bacterium]